MNSAHTVEHLHKDELPEASATSFWPETFGQQVERFFGLSHIAKATGLAIWLSVSPVTAITDPWLLERRRRDAVVTVSIYQELLGRFLTRVEALRIAGEILEQAEQERLLLAEYEAARGIQWENHE